MGEKRSSLEISSTFSSDARTPMLWNQLVTRVLESALSSFIHSGTLRVITSGGDVFTVGYRIARMPSLVGCAYAQNREDENFPREFIEALKTNSALQWDFAHGAIVTYYEAPATLGPTSLLIKPLKKNGALSRFSGCSFPCQTRSILSNGPLRSVAKLGRRTGPSLKSSRSMCPRLQGHAWLSACFKPSGHGQPFSLRGSMPRTFLRACLFAF